jgi:hypothetical protein
VPTPILAGEEDRLDSVEQHRREVQSRIPNSRLEIITEAVTCLPSMNLNSWPQQYTDFLRKLLAGGANSSGMISSEEGAAHSP